MSKTSEPITITLDRRLFEHPEALHIRRMRAAVWLYLALAARASGAGETVEIDPAEFAARMGLPEGTVRSWLGHLRRARYVDVERRNGTLQVTLRRSTERPLPSPPAKPPEADPQRAFTVAKLARALGDRENDQALSAALDSHPDDAIRRALAKTLAVPAERIRRSRTALFFYLLNHDDQTTEHHPRD